MSIRSFFFQSGEHFTPIAGLRMCLDKTELELGIRHEVLQNAEAHLGQKSNDRLMPWRRLPADAVWHSHCGDPLHSRWNMVAGPTIGTELLIR